MDCKGTLAFKLEQQAKRKAGRFQGVPEADVTGYPPISNATGSFEEMVAFRVQRMRIWRGMTQAELAAKTGLKPAAISHLECGRRMPSAFTLHSICLALKCRADYILMLWNPKRRKYA